MAIGLCHGFLASELQLCLFKNHGGQNHAVFTPKLDHPRGLLPYPFPEYSSGCPPALSVLSST